MLFFLKPVFSPNKLKLLKLDLNSISDQNNTLKNLLIFDGLVKYHRSARILLFQFQEAVYNQNICWFRLFFNSNQKPHSNSSCKNS